MVEPEADKSQCTGRIAVRRPAAETVAVDEIRERSGNGSRFAVSSIECGARRSLWRCPMAAKDRFEAGS